MWLVHDPFVLYAAPALVTLFFITFYLTNLALTQFVGRGRPASSSATPPRAESPKEEKDSTLFGLTPTEYTDILPPSTREYLAEVIRKISLTAVINPAVDEVEVRKNLISFETDYRACGPSTYTPTGVSIEEVQTLGDFPDYASLSGVPLPNKYEGFQIEKAIPRPYRPFRWAYYQTMSLTKLETDWWLELEKNYVSTVAQRVELFKKHGPSVLEYLPGSELACKETMEIALQFYCARYPQHFSLEQQSSGWVFKNGLLKTETDIRQYHPLHILLHNIPEDFAIMMRNPEDGYYYFRAGVICSSLGWNLGTKLGMKLNEIHGPIPDYKEKMEFSMDRYFSKMPTPRPIQRGSWGLEIDTPLFMPPDDPHEAYRSSQMPSLSLSRIHLRVDWQTLRRLPLSGGIVFNFRALFTPLEKFREEPFVPSLVLKVLKEGKREIMEYKNTWHVEHVTIPALEAWQAEQVAKKIIPEGWEVRTLDEAPFYPGWEEKWKAEQGF